MHPFENRLAVIVLATPLVVGCAVGVEETATTNEADPSAPGNGTWGPQQQETTEDATPDPWEPKADGGAEASGSSEDAAANDVAEAVCSPGDVKVVGECGQCGTLQRVCEAGSWSALQCTDEGACSPGDVQSAACGGECGGTQTRRCQADCSWGPFEACTGSTTCACGLFCTGSVACNNGMTGTAQVSGSDCRLSDGAGGRITLACDHTLSASGPQGTTTGSWTGSDHVVHVNIVGLTETTCTIQ